jgi:pimeloyl-ACP methyl ester carboxylesterase
MPFANCHGIQIYYEVDGAGPPLVLAHGLSGSTNMWKKPGLADMLRKSFQLILFDARGHGRSDKPHEPSAYGLRMVDDMVAVLDDLKIRKAHYFGYSMGARIGFRIALFHSDRVSSFVLGGGSPYRNESEQKEEERLMQGLTLLRDDKAAYLRQWERALGRPLTLQERDSQLGQDAEALIAVFRSFIDMVPLDNRALSEINVPCLIYCGDADPRFSGARESVNHIPRAKFISLPGLDHVKTLMRTDLVIPHVTNFLTNIRM